MKAKQRSLQLCAWLLTACLLAPSSLDARYQPTRGWNAFSEQDEVQAGREAATETNRKMPVLPESDPITVYVQHLGAQLAQHAPGEKWPYSFHVVNQKEINAFALPGGPIYVNLGTIQAADNEAELAGVMAHEISHVVQRHATRAASRQMAAQLPLAVLGGLLGRGAGAQLAQLGISFGFGSYFLHNSRQAESEADLIGTDIMYDTGFNPHAMADFFQKLNQEGGARGPQFFSDHPDPGNRAQAVSREVTTLAPKTYRSDNAEFRRTKQLAGGMKPLTAQQIAASQQASSPGGGGVPAAELPSSNTRVFRHSEYEISYPENWQVFGDAKSAVTIAPASGVSENAIAYGALINEYQPEKVHASLDDATHELIASMRQSNPDMRQLGHDETIRVNGVAGKSVDLIATSPLTGADGKAVRERDWLVAIPGAHGGLLYVVFIAPDPEFGQLRPTFEQMLRSLRVK
jgi:Zn-dependent protease with chaperone function